MISVEAMIRPDIAGLAPYSSIVPLEVLAERLGIPQSQIVKLDANESPYGPTLRVLEALRHYPHYSIYPDPNQTQLRRAISAYVGQPVERILCGNGSDELIDLLLRLFIGPNDVVVDCPPTFAMYSFKTGVVGGRIFRVPRTEDFGVDLEAVAEAVVATGAKLIFLSSPNNPDGGILSREIILQLLKLPSILVIDEVYAEFSNQSVADLVGQYPNLVVLRSFSKWAGLAGLRIGYGLFPEPLITHLWKIKPPYNVNVAAQVAALASLEDLETLRANVARIIAERERFLAMLSKIDGLRPYPSYANFIVCRMLRRNAQLIKDDLEHRGILVRYFRQPGLEDCLRISVGTPEQNDRVLMVLRKILGEQDE